MELHDFINLVARKRKTVFGIIALFIILGAGIIAVQRFKYSSKSQLLVVQEYNRTVDAYTASKSNEYLSSVLANVVVSNSFFTKVTEAGFDINTSYFGDNTKDQMKEWNRTVSAKSISDSGIISVVVYHPDRSQAEKIDRAINHVLMTQNAAYHGSGDTVKVRLIDQPITSTLPVKPDIFLTMALAIALGFVTSLIYIYLAPTPALRTAHRYGQHAPYRHGPESNQDMIGEGGYIEDVAPLSPEELVRQGNMRNLLK
jgi:capsular polysaccharide biosynthesis protein